MKIIRMTPEAARIIAETLLNSAELSENERIDVPVNKPPEYFTGVDERTDQIEAIGIVVVYA